MLAGTSLEQKLAHAPALPSARPATVGLLGVGWVQREGLCPAEAAAVCAEGVVQGVDCLGMSRKKQAISLGFASPLPWQIGLHVVNEEFKWGPL